MLRISATGMVATTPQFEENNGANICKFRFASSSPTNHHTSWLTVFAYGQVAAKAYASLTKGDKISVIGELIISDWYGDDLAGNLIEIEAESIAIDVTSGRSATSREENTQLRRLIGDISEVITAHYEKENN